MTRPTSTIREPVAVAGAIQALLVAVFSLANLFDWWHWSDEQTAGVGLLYVAFVGVLTAITRGKVAPVDGGPPFGGEREPDHQ